MSKFAHLVFCLGYLAALAFAWRHFYLLVF